MAKPNEGRPKRTLADLAGSRDRGAAKGTGGGASGGVDWHARLRRVVHGPGFTAFTNALIAVNALALGIEAVPTLGEPMAGALDALFGLSTAYFVVEIALRMIAHGKPIGGFFRDGWNLFDTLIVALSLLPLAGGVAIIARLVRLLRLFRLVSGTALLRGFVEGRLALGRHLIAGGLLLALSLYAFALAGFHLAGGVLTENGDWEALGPALMSSVKLLVPIAPPSLPVDGAGSLAFVALFAAAHLAWLAMFIRGLLRGRAPGGNAKGGRA